jgi:2-methylisocitrate lyase-like PEP mutase family enzyme
MSGLRSSAANVPGAAQLNRRVASRNGLGDALPYISSVGCCPDRAQINHTRETTSGRTMTAARKLRELLAQPNVEIMPGCYDAISAKLVAAAGFNVTFMSGFAVAAARLGLPDTGLISFTEMVDSLRSCCSGAGKVPVIGDGDTGYGNALNVQRTVTEYARAGAACVMIEDQVSPKKCGHTRGKLVIPREEARMKIRAAVEAKADADILVMARTDARAVHGFDEALARCKDFEAEGADIIFLEAPETEDEMRRFCSAMKKPCLANMVLGGKTPVLSPSKLQEIGYKLALYPVMLLSSSISAMQATLEGLKPGSKTPQPPAISFGDLQGVVGFPDYWSRETRYQAKE